MIDLKLLRQLIKLMTDNDLTELDLQDGEEKVKLKRGPEGGIVVPAAAPPVHAPAPAATAAAQPSGDAPAPSDDAGLEKVTSPMVGTFYSSPSPDASAFVKVGDKIGPDSVVCIIEAMKVFNEIKSETAGTIEKVLVENGQPVEFGQPLYLVRP